MNFKHAPIDSVSAARLDAQGLRLGLVDTGDANDYGAWLGAAARGFHGPTPSPSAIDENLLATAYRRVTAVWDDTAADAATPVATVSTWPTELTVPGETALPAWAISAVTVAPTHRRRGIARALLEAELRTAASLDVPVAILTASEATIYSRYGFAPAAMTADLTIDTRRASWTGPTASGRVQFVPLDQLHDVGRALLDRVRMRIPGDIALDDYLWARLLGEVGDGKDEAKHLRAVRYDDGDGVTQGFAVYRVTQSETDFALHTAAVHYLAAATDDAYAGLWHYLLELDLVGIVQAPLRAVDEPVAWQLSDFRARKTQERDHLWLRILDTARTLEVRRYSAPGRIALEVSDPLGFAEARVLVSIDAAGAAAVSPLTGEAPDDAAALALTVNELAALYLGGTSVHSLVRAGLITELRPGSADAVDASFRSAVAPWLSVWF